MFFNGRTPFNIVDFKDELTTLKIQRKLNLSRVNFYLIRSNGIDDLSNGLNFNNFIYGGEYESLISEWKIKTEASVLIFHSLMRDSYSPPYIKLLKFKPLLRSSIPFDLIK